MRKLSAKNLILDLLRASAPEPLSVKWLVDVGELFGFTENSVRVNITRLLAKDILEQDERGLYRFGDSSSSLLGWVNQWKVGERRARTWEGGWLTLAFKPEKAKGRQQALLKALERLGFAGLWPGFFVRPDNLIQSQAEMQLWLQEQAGDPNFILAKAEHLYEEPFHLWDLEGLNIGYQQMIEVLKLSLERIPSKTLPAALVESFTVGGEAIHILALDPLLPEPHVDAAARAELTELMLHYDAVGRSLWQEFFDTHIFTELPGANLSIQLF